MPVAVEGCNSGAEVEAKGEARRPSNLLRRGRHLRRRAQGKAQGGAAGEESRDCAMAAGELRGAREEG